MGKKTKLGKFRKDKFYKLAKEIGFRSRAAFKLIQLNRKFGFLQQNQVCLDLCAAPGGWMQVAKQNMAVSSVVIGVDLYPIRPIPGCISIIGDITTDSCKSAISGELKSWKVDVVLHDGAPNVGKNWLYDAYQQICLTLSAVKLASNFMRSGGWFVTKVFRSKDYNALIWVLKQLFKSVHATKPSASRKESAEIFVVCKGYLAPHKIDPKLFDPKYVFEDLNLDKKKASLLHPEKQKRIKAEGYTEKDILLRNELPVMAFLQSSNGIAALEGISSIIIDHDGVRNHPRTTNEILECCKDIKVLGRKDLKGLLNWWKHLKEEFVKIPKEETTQPERISAEKETGSNSEAEIDDLMEEVEQLERTEQRELKRKRKKMLKERVKLNQKMNLKMVIKGDQGPHEEAEEEMFGLKQIETVNDLENLQDIAPDFALKTYEEKTEKLPKYKRYNKEQMHLDDDGLYENSSVEEDSLVSDKESECGQNDFDLRDYDDNQRSTHKKREKCESIATCPLIQDTDFREKDVKRQQRVQLWFEKDDLQNIDTEDDADYDLDQLTNTYESKGVQILCQKENKVKSINGISTSKTTKLRRKSVDSTSSSTLSDTTNTDDKPNENTSDTKNECANMKKIRLSEEELALGAILIKGRKSKRDLIDSAWNRYTFNDENLPHWFVQDEEKNMRKAIPVPEEAAEEYEKKVRELNVRPIKKVMEAKARKKKRALKRLAKAQKKTEHILEDADSTPFEKMRQIRKLYKKAKDGKKKELTYVVAKKHLASKRVRRPPGVKGRFKVVDPRMKKDKRANKNKKKK